MAERAQAAQANRRAGALQADGQLVIVRFSIPDQRLLMNGRDNASNSSAGKRSSGSQGTRLFSVEELRHYAEQTGAGPSGRASVDKPVLKGISAGLDGRRFTAPELQAILRQKFPKLVSNTPAEARPDIVFDFAYRDAVQFRLSGGRLELMLSLTALQQGGNRARLDGRRHGVVRCIQRTQQRLGQTEIRKRNFTH